MNTSHIFIFNKYAKHYVRWLAGWLAVWEVCIKVDRQTGRETNVFMRRFTCIYRIVDDAARNELFVDDDGNAFDLVARNIQV